MKRIKKYEKKYFPSSALLTKPKDMLRITKRPVISSELKWDNKRISFPELNNRLEAYIIQAGTNYMIKSFFSSNDTKSMESKCCGSTKPRLLFPRHNSYMTLTSSCMDT